MVRSKYINIIITRVKTNKEVTHRILAENKSLNAANGVFNSKNVSRSSQLSIDNTFIGPKENSNSRHMGNKNSSQKKERKTNKKLEELYNQPSIKKE